MALWAALLIVSAVYMGAIDTLPEGASGWRKLWKGGGLLLLVYGIVLIIGLASGGRDVFHPLKNIGLSGGTGSEQSSHLAFRQIKGVDGLNAALADARAQGKTVMLDFYADWCISCKEMEALTFTDPRVQQALADTVLLQADVTPNDEQDVALYKHFGIIGPPSIMFFDRDGNERKNYRVVGFVPADEFSEHVKRALN
jgi:thiol:disulfide interchange protein DsbD